MESLVRRLGVGLLERVYPRFCFGCGAEGTAWCAGCAGSFAPAPPVARCPFCEREGSCRTCAACREHASLDGLTAFVPYGNATVREALTRWKYHGDPATGEAIARWVRQCAASREPGAFPSGATVTHVPLHASRLRHRGFDQAEGIARTLAAARGLAFAPLLVRAEATASQARRNVHDRRASDLAGAFLAAGPVPRKVILCDDVSTSGATMDAAAAALKDAGAEQVWGFAVARGSHP